MLYAATRIPVCTLTGRHGVQSGQLLRQAATAGSSSAQKTLLLARRARSVYTGSSPPRSRSPKQEKKNQRLVERLSTETRRRARPGESSRATDSRGRIEYQRSNRSRQGSASDQDGTPTRSPRYLEKRPWNGDSNERRYDSDRRREGYPGARADNRYPREYQRYSSHRRGDTDYHSRRRSYRDESAEPQHSESDSSASSTSAGPSFFETIANVTSRAWQITTGAATSFTAMPTHVEPSGRHSSPIPPPPATRRLESSDGPLVWIDCEMTGLDMDNDRIIEIACIVTDGDLKKVDDGVSYIVKTDKAHLDRMGEWCTRQHGESGLTAACLDDSVSRDHADVRAAILAYVRDRVPIKRSACLAGNTVHADARFLSKEMPELVNHLHYRIVDVSSIKELVRRWYGNDDRWVGTSSNHRALDDIDGSIRELQYYRQRIFPATLPPLPAETAEKGVMADETK